MLGCHSAGYTLPYVLVNFVTCVPLVVAKLPEMTGVRLIGRACRD